MSMNHSQSDLPQYDLSFVLLKPGGRACVAESYKRSLPLKHRQKKFLNAEMGMLSEKIETDEATRSYSQATRAAAVISKLGGALETSPSGGHQEMTIFWFHGSGPLAAEAGGADSMGAVAVGAGAAGV